MSPRRVRLDPWLVSALALSLLAAAPLYAGLGLLNTRGGGDSPFLLFRVYELADSLRAGVFPVRWMPHAAYGYGFPFFNFYAALPFYFAAVLRVLGFGIVGALKAVHALGFVLAAAGMYAWARRALGSAPAACVAAVAYSYAPFHLVNVYVRGDSLGEFYAFAWYPWILLALARLIEKPGARRAAALALAYGALIMTHNVSALIFTPFVALYAVVLLARARAPRRVWLAALGAGVLGVALAAWVWAPALGEGQFVHLEVQTTGYFNYAEHFRTPAPGADAAASLVQSALAFRYDVGEGTTPFAMGLVQAVLAGAGALALAWQASRRRNVHADVHAGVHVGVHAALALAGLLLATFMITPWSRGLYEHVPLLSFVQFPWRFLSLQSLFAAMAIGALIPRASGRSEVVSRLLPAAALGLALVAPMWPGLPHDFLRVGDADVTPERLQLYELFTGNIGTTIRAEYLPRWVVPRPYTSGQLLYGRPDPAKVLSGSAAVARVWQRPDAQGWHVDTQGAATVAFPLLYFPGWGARVDGAPVPVRPLDGLGWLALDLPAGAHDVTLQLYRTPLRAAAEALSAAAALAVIGLWFSAQMRRRFAGAGSDNPQGAGGWSGGIPASGTRSACLTLGAFGLAVLLATPLLQPSLPALPEDDLTWDFASAPYLAHGPVHVEGDAWLKRYNYSSDAVRAGEPFTMTVEWDGGRPAASAYSIVAAGCDLPEVQCGRTWTWQTVRGEVDRLSGTPAMSAPGLYWARLTWPAGYVDLRPVRVLPGPGQASAVHGETPDQIEVTLDEARSRPGAAVVAVRWLPQAVRSANYGLSVRLAGPQGVQWASRDVIAGAYGFYPSSLWTPGIPFTDLISVDVPEGLPPGTISATLTVYDIATLAPVAPPHAQPLTWDKPTLRPGLATLARFGALGLQALDAPDRVQQGEPLVLTAGWWAGQAPLPKLRARWELLAADGSSAYTLDSPLAAGSDETLWPQDAYVLGKHVLKLPADLPAGAYTLRLAVLDASGNSLGVYERPLAVAGITRNFTVPPMAVSVNADYGGIIRLYGYTLERSGDTLKLTLAWGALQAPGRDYKVFVHLFNPADESIPVQHDAQPRDNTYPTSRWLQGEVVTDTITLDLAPAPPGAYRIGVGLYDEAGRLGERVVLPDEVRR